MNFTLILLFYLLLILLSLYLTRGVSSNRPLVPLQAYPGRWRRKRPHPCLWLLRHRGCQHSPVPFRTAGKIKHFVTDGACWHFITFISVFNLSYQVVGFCIINSVTGSIHLHVCSISAVTLRAIQENNAHRFHCGVGEAAKWAPGPQTSPSRIRAPSFASCTHKMKAPPAQGLPGGVESTVGRCLQQGLVNCPARCLFHSCSH